MYARRCVLTPAFIHAPGLCPDLEGVRFLLDSGVSGVLWGQSWQGLGGGWREGWRGGGRRGGSGGSGLAWHGSGASGGIGVGTAIAAYAVLGAALAVLPLQSLLRGQIKEKNERERGRKGMSMEGGS